MGTERTRGRQCRAGIRCRVRNLLRSQPSPSRYFPLRTACRALGAGRVDGCSRGLRPKNLQREADYALREYFHNISSIDGPGEDSYHRLVLTQLSSRKKWSDRWIPSKVRLMGWRSRCGRRRTPVDRPTRALYAVRAFAGSSITPGAPDGHAAGALARRSVAIRMPVGCAHDRTTEGSVCRYGRVGTTTTGTSGPRRESRRRKSSGRVE